MNKKKLFLLSIMLLSAFLMGCVFIYVVKPPQGADFGVYQRLGRNLAQSHGYSPAKEAPYTPGVRVPLYPLFLAIIYNFFGFNDRAVFLWQAALYALTALFLYLTTKELLSEKIALTAGFLFSLYPITSYWVGVLYPEILTTYVLMVVTFFLVKYIKMKKISYLYWAGIFTGMLILTRRVFVLYPFAIILCFFLLKLPWKKIILNSGVVILLVSAVMSPWIIRNYAVHNEFVPLVKGYGPGILFYLSTVQYKDDWHGVAYYTDPQYLKQLEEMRSQGDFTERFPQDYNAGPICWRYGIKNILDDPFTYIFSYAKKLPRLYIPMYSPTFSKRMVVSAAVLAGGVFLLGIIGIWLMRKRWRELVFLLLPLAYVTSVNLPLAFQSRYSIPVRPYLMIFVAALLVKLFFRKEVVINADKK